jgi:orotate phosphoribosyltransferase/uncharacterized HAD superfamily protein
MFNVKEDSQKGLQIAKNRLKQNRFILTNYRRIRHHRFNVNTEVVKVNDQINLTMKWLKTLPNQFDVVIGIPRAGVMIANAISLQFCIPWSLPSCFLENKQVFYSSILKTPEIERVLIVEDCISQGREINEVKAAIKAKYPDLTVKTGSLLVNTANESVVDYYYRNVEKKAIETVWDLLKLDKNYVVDMDGVLNYNPSDKDTASVDSYLQFIENAQPYLLLRSKIDTIVTARPEWARKPTERWLRKHKVQYNKLVMLEGHGLTPPFEAAVAHKISTLKYTQPEIFWESDYNQAKMIHKKTGIKVLCTDNMCLFGV